MDQQAHVHFEQEDVVSHENKINVKQSKPGCIDVHVGFLQIYHKYEIEFMIPGDYLPKSNNVVPEVTDVPSICRILKMTPGDESNVCFTFEVLPMKEKLYREKVVLMDANEKANKCQITLHCRVLGKGKGTPMLKNGIKCSGTIPDPNESESQSDWKGF